MIIEGTAATTHLLPNGYQHSLDDLEVLAARHSSEKPFVYLDHRPDQAPLGQIVRAWIAPLDDGEHALRVEVEVESGADPEQVKAVLARGALSVAFFVGGVCNFSQDVGDADVTIGFSPGLGVDPVAALKDVEQAVPDTRLAVREYHEHAASVPLSVLIWIAGAVGTIILDVALRDKIAAIIKSVSRAVGVRGIAPDVVRVAIGSTGREVEVRVPWDGEPDAIQEAVTDALEDALARNRRGEVSYESLGE